MTSTDDQGAGGVAAPAPSPAVTRTGRPFVDPAGAPGRRPSVALVGVHGHGRSHVRDILRLDADGTARLAGLVDPRPASADDVGLEAGDRDTAERLRSTPWHADLSDLLATGAPDVVVLCTPIHTHHDLAAQALRAGCDVLLQKPPTASLAELENLLDVEAETGRRVQVGFQTFGSQTLPPIARLVEDGEIGEVAGVTAVGTWVRTTAYWTRSSWTGRRTLGDRPVVDGVVTNPLAHAVATALHLAGARTTSCGRTDLLTDLLAAHRGRHRIPLLSPLHGTGAFMRVLDAVRAAPDPTRIDPRHVERLRAAGPGAPWAGEPATHLVVRDVERWCHRAAQEHATFRELGAPWAAVTTAAAR